VHVGTFRRSIAAQGPSIDTFIDGFAVVDLETTGFSWVEGDRVVEMAVVLLDGHGAPTGGWATLVNPGRPIAGTHIHGITDRDVVHAPDFSQLGGLLAQSCAGRILVAHNLAFDSYFLYHELAAAGVDIELGPRSGICTMQLAGHYYPRAPVALGPLCRSAGIEIRHRHWALWDAEATGRLLRTYIEQDRAFFRHWSEDIERGLTVRWPASLLDGACLLPRCPPTAGHPDDDWCAAGLSPADRRSRLHLGSWPHALSARLHRA
jgi:DNA polymerase-3 subunit epsilon